jgi:hypothetical protein
MEKKNGILIILTAVVLLYAMIPFFPADAFVSFAIVSAAGTATLYVTGVLQKKLHPDHRAGIYDWVMLICMLVSLGMILMYCLGTEDTQQAQLRYNAAVYVLIMTVLYIIMRLLAGGYERIYLILPHIMAAPVFICLLRDLVFPEKIFLLSRITVSGSVAAISAIFCGMMASASYSDPETHEKGYSVIYLAEAWISFLVLLIDHLVIMNIMMIIWLMLAAVLDQADDERLRRHLVMIFSYGILYAFMPVISRCREIIAVECHIYSYNTGIVLMVLLSAVGLICIRMTGAGSENSRNMPETNMLIMQWIFVLTVSILLICIVITSMAAVFADVIPKGIIWDNLKACGNSMLRSMQGSMGNMLSIRIADVMGIPGLLIFWFMWTVTLIRLVSRRDSQSEISYRKMVLGLTGLIVAAVCPVENSMLFISGLLILLSVVPCAEEKENKERKNA